MRTASFHFSTHDQGDKVRTTAHIAKSASTPKAGLFATVRALLDPQGTGAPARSSVVAILASLCALAVGLLFASSALALNPERHYEMVSPPFKASFGVNAGTFGTSIIASPGGEALSFFSDGAFAGAPSAFNGDLGYVARRGAEGWLTSPLMAPVSLIAEPTGSGGDMTPSLDRVLEMGAPGASAEDPNPEQVILTHDALAPDAPEAWEHDAAAIKLVSGVTTSLHPLYQASDERLCLALVSAGGAEPLVPEAPRAVGELYQVGLGCDGHMNPLELVGLNNRDKLMSECAVTLGAGTLVGDGRYVPATEDAFNAVSGDGSEVFFTTCTGGSGEASKELPHQLFVRLDRSRTLEVSRPLGEPCEAGGIAGEVPCARAEQRASADFQGASSDGSRVYFTAPLAGGQSPLVPSDADSSENLYLATIGCPEAKPGCGASERIVTGLTEASHDPNPGQPADVMGVVRVAPDGQRAYFVAGGDLLTTAQQGTLEAEGRPVPQAGAANLYVFDAGAEGAAGSVAFIGDLCSGADLSGAAEDAACPSNGDEELWRRESEPGFRVKEGSHAQTAGADGRFFVFTTYAQLAHEDTNRASDVYRYAAASGHLNRVSLGETGFDDNGNREVLNGSGEPLGAQIAAGFYGGRTFRQHELNNRAVSEDGSVIVFTSAEPLSPNATNGLENVYEWHETPDGKGTVSIVSTGSAEAGVPSTVLTMSAEGEDVFFVTSQSLLRQDKDVLMDVYDARTGPGFAPVPSSTQPCSGDACQGPLTNPAPLLVPASVVQAPGGNLAPPPVVKTAKSKKAVNRCRKGRSKRSVRCSHRARKQTGKKSSRRGR
jgi:hypothetical protein